MPPPSDATNDNERADESGVPERAEENSVLEGAEHDSELCAVERIEAGDNVAGEELDEEEGASAERPSIALRFLLRSSAGRRGPAPSGEASEDSEDSGEGELAGDSPGGGRRGEVADVGRFMVRRPTG